MKKFDQIDLTIAGLKKHYANGDFSPIELLQCLQNEYRMSNEKSNNPIWITLLDDDQLAPYLHFLEEKSPETLPLFGVPFAIKDNIDLAGIPTTAACLDFTYTPEHSAFVVQQLINAGAIPIGKTNMDQFATGLVGVRSPECWGPVHNALNENYISGGSSSGSAVAVAKKWVSFSLGTDTAGSGRVPASLNNIIGLKPTKGLLSTQGVVPACRSLDSVSIFSLTIDDVNTVFDIAAQFDETDPYAKRNSFANGKHYYGNHESSELTVGVPRSTQLNFFGNNESSTLFKNSVDNIKKLGVTIVDIDFEPFLEAAKLLYEGPWVAERYLAAQPLIDESPESLLPVIRTIIEKGNSFSATDAFRFQYLLQHLKQQADKILTSVDMVVTPTAGTIFTIDEVIHDPIQLNSNMGYYTNFMNLLDCAAVVVPTGFYKIGLGFGVTFFHNALSDKRLLSFAAELQNSLALRLGAASINSQPLKSRNDLLDSPATKPPSTTINVVVCGAHLKGLPLNWQLVERGATLLEKTQSSPDYKLYALAGGPPFRPGMVRVNEGGQSIEVEVWKIPSDNFGSFVAEIPSPLGIGKVQLADGRWESGFICENKGLEGATDITALKSWRNYINKKTTH